MFLLYIHYSLAVLFATVMSLDLKHEDTEQIETLRGDEALATEEKALVWKIWSLPAADNMAHVPPFLHEPNQERTLFEAVNLLFIG